MRIVWIFAIALAAACARVTEVPVPMGAQSEPPVEAPPVAVIQEPPVEAPPVAVIQEPAAAAEPPAPVASSPSAPQTVAPPAKAPAKASAPPVKALAKASTQPVKTPEKPAAPLAASEQPSKKPAPPPASGMQGPQLDVTSLIARLRDTEAIGVMTKLALKNQVDDLLKKFRAHYQSGQKPTVAELRQPYDMLVMKVLALVQDKDPSLARSISNSRGAIWEILTDREKFNAIA